MPTITIREGVRRDAKEFVRLMVGLANFEHLDPPDAAARRRIVSDVFSKKLARLFLAYWKQRPVGYALYYYTYSSFLAKPTFYLEDIFVLEGYRKKGVGRALFLRCVEEAEKRGCGRFEFAVLTWNKNAIQFYERIGAKRLNRWHYYRLDSKIMENLRRPNQNLKQTFPPA